MKKTWWWLGWAVVSQTCVGSCRDYGSDTGRTSDGGGVDEGLPGGVDEGLPGGNDSGGEGHHEMLTGGQGGHQGGAMRTSTAGQGDVIDAGGQAGAGRSSGEGGTQDVLTGAQGGHHEGEAFPNGAGEAGFNGGDEPVLPACSSGPSGHPIIAVTPATDVALSLTWAAVPYVLFATQPATDLVTVSWKMDYPETAPWVRWSCFDHVARPSRIAASNLANGFSEVYVVGNDGALSMRQQVHGGYVPWMNVSIPPATEARDVHVVDPMNQRPTLYLATDTGLYARTRTGDDPYAPFGAWQRITSEAVSIVSATAWLDGRHNVVLVDQSNNARELIQARVGDVAEFVEGPKWEVLALDVTFAADALGAQKVFVLTDDGAVLVRSAGPQGGEWVQIKAPESEPALVTLTAGSAQSQGISLFGVDENGTIQMSIDGGASWAAMP